MPKQYKIQMNMASYALLNLMTSKSFLIKQQNSDYRFAGEPFGETDYKQTKSQTNTALGQERTLCAHKKNRFHIPVSCPFNHPVICSLLGPKVCLLFPLGFLPCLTRRHSSRAVWLKGLKGSSRIASHSQGPLQATTANCRPSALW